MRFDRLLVQDFSQFWMNRKSAKHYRGVSNNSGTAAAAKLDLIMELHSGQFIDCEEVEARTQDRKLGPILLDEVGERDLVIRDLGYFDVSGFQCIERNDGFWISRLHGSADVFLDNGKDWKNCSYHGKIFFESVGERHSKEASRTPRCR